MRLCSKAARRPRIIIANVRITLRETAFSINNVKYFTVRRRSRFSERFNGLIISRPGTERSVLLLHACFRVVFNYETQFNVCCYTRAKRYEIHHVPNTNYANTSAPRYRPMSFLSHFQFARKRLGNARLCVTSARYFLLRYAQLLSYFALKSIGLIG